MTVRLPASQVRALLQSDPPFRLHWSDGAETAAISGVDDDGHGVSGFVRMERRVEGTEVTTSGAVDGDEAARLRMQERVDAWMAALGARPIEIAQTVD